MTWNPPPESERPHYYECLGLIAIQEPDFVWTECVWDEDDRVWYSVLNDCDNEEPVAFAPLPEVTTARIAELEAEVARLFAWQAKAENALKHAQAFLDDEHPKWEEHQILGIDCLWKLIREAIAKPEQAGGPTDD
jgi:hypothetical protein